MYSENFENSHMFRFIFKQIYNIWVDLISRLKSVFEMTTLLNLPINSIFLRLLLPESLMRLL